jgi:hypothetical protein
MAAGFLGFVVLSSNLVRPHSLGIPTMRHVRAGSMLIRFFAFSLVAALAASAASLGFEQ